MKLVNQQLIKDTNLKLVYRHIYQQRGISRADLAKITKLSKTTISALTDELIDRKFIYDTGARDTDSSSVGRKPSCLEICSESYYVIVIRWEETRIQAHLVDICGVSSFQTRRELTLPEDSYVSLSRRCVDEFLQKQCPREKILGICFVVPGMMDPERKEIYTTSLDLARWQKIDAAAELKRTFQDFPIALLNDTACFAYAEKVFTNIAEKDFAFINFNRGIGATLFIGDEMLGHAAASCTQFGHYSIDPRGKPCPCGNRGCLELMIGEDSLKERLDQIGGSPALKRKKRITYAELGSAAMYGDSASVQLIRDIAREFSLALSNLICMVYPKLIILGGNGKDLGPLFLDEIRNTLKVCGFKRMVSSVETRFSLLDDSACFSGAMKYFFDIHYKFTQHLSGAFFIG